MARSPRSLRLAFSRSLRSQQRDNVDALYALGEHLRDSIDLDLITVKLVIGLNEIYDLEHAAVFMRLDDIYAVAHAAGDMWDYPPSIPFDDPLVEMARTSELPLKPTEVEELTPGWLFLTEREVRRVLALVAHEELFGFVALGRKREARRYSDAELEALAALGLQAGHAIRLALQVRARQAQALEEQRQEAERRAARRLQRSLLPTQRPIIRGWDLAGVTEPSQNPAGGWFDFFVLDDQHLGVAVGGVAGRGLEAVRAMALASTIVRVEARHTASPADVLSRVNALLADQFLSEMKVLVVYGRLGLRSGRFEYATAGPAAPLLLLPDLPEPLGYEADGLLIGTFSAVAYKLHRLDVPHGAALLLYSQGIVQATSSEGEQFGLDGLLAALRGRNTTSAGRLTAGALTKLRAFLGPNPLPTDVTLVAVRRLLT